jgi:3D (Asp-Asp-Asp) domain-containing protein
MPKTKLDTQQVQTWLKLLGYYDGPINGDYLDANYRSDLRRFQADNRRVAGRPDGWYGLKTEAALLPLIEMWKRAGFMGAPPSFAHDPSDIDELRRWTLTYYYIGDQARWRGPRNIPFYTTKGKVIANVEAGCYVEAALEGTTRLRDGRLVNVARGAMRKVNPADWVSVYAIIKRNGWLDKPGYGGVALSKDKKRVVGARRFSVKKPGPGGYPVEREGIELDPFRTLASDTGRLRRHDPKWRGKGGVVPSGTEVFILEMVGVKLPDGTTHDGWFRTNDTGGGIFGAHFDVFTGTRLLANKVHIPHRAHIWFPGIEKKLSMNYSYGL